MCFVDNPIRGGKLFGENEKLFSSVCAPSHLHRSLELAEKCGTELAHQLLADGAGKILLEAKNASKTP